MKVSYNSLMLLRVVLVVMGLVALAWAVGLLLRAGRRRRVPGQHRRHERRS